jgi:hypothetical protein
MSSVFLFCVLRNDFEAAHFESSFIVVFPRFKFSRFLRDNFTDRAYTIGYPIDGGGGEDSLFHVPIMCQVGSTFSDGCMLKLC